jgi:VCBS repeat-containing protein
VLVTDVSNGALTLNADGSFTYTPAADFNGLDSFTYHANDGTLDSVDVTVTITVNAVNDAPSFTKGANIVVDEDAPAHLVAAWASAISAGPVDEAGQSLLFTVTITSGSGLFAAAPAIDALTGDLTFTPAADAWGTAQLEVFLSDNGGGTDASAVEIFEITINPIEDAPSYVAGPAVTVLEDSGLHTAAGWATAINHGQGSTLAALTFVVTNNTNAALFAVAPAVDPLTGDLSFTPAADANGTASITLVLEDSGAPIMQSPAQTFTVTVTAVNDAPTFVAGPRVRWNTKEGPGSIQAWATSILAGPANELAQGLTFLTTIVGGEKLLDAVPAIDGAGNLSYNPSSRANGTAVIAVILMDNGGTANGGVDATAAVTFEIEFNFEQSSSDPEGCTSGSGSGLPWLFASLVAMLSAAGLRRKLAARKA